MSVPVTVDADDLRAVLNEGVHPAEAGHRARLRAALDAAEPRWWIASNLEPQARDNGRSHAESNRLIVKMTADGRWTVGGTDRALVEAVAALLRDPKEQS